MSRTDTSTFTEEQAQRIWSDYMREVEILCGSLDSRQTDDILSELKAHLLESFIKLDGGDEANRLSVAIKKLGQPQEFVPHWVEERLLDGAQPGRSARNMFFLLKSNALRGAQQFAFSMMVGFGYLLSFYFFIMSVMKVVFPDNIGLYLTPSGIPILGYVDADEFVEVLGYWLIPIGIATAISLQFVLNRVVRRWIVHYRR